MIITYSKYLFSIAALFAGCFFLLSGCENDLRIVDNLYKKNIGVEEAFKIESYLSQDGFVKAKLTAPYMLRTVSDTPYIEFPRTLHADFYDSSGKMESFMNARYGKYFESDRKVLLKDSVLVINLKNGDTLRTQKLWWDQNKSQFYTDDTAYIYQPDKVILAAKGLEASQNLNNIKFFSSSGVLAVPKSDSTGGVPDTTTGAPTSSAPAAKTNQPPPANNTPRINRDSILKKNTLLPLPGKDSGRDRPAIFRGKQ